MATSYDYADEFTKQLARKRQLAALLQNQALGGMHLTNPQARGSWLNALAPLAQAYFGSKMSDQANTEGMAHQNELNQQMQDAFANMPQPTPAMPARPDMNLPGDLASMAGTPDTRPPTDATSAMQSQQPTNPMAQLLAGQNGPSLGAKMAQDQTPPMVPDLGQIGQQAAATPPPLIPRDLGSMDVVGQKQPTDPMALAEQQAGLLPGTLKTRQMLEASPVGSVNAKSGAAGPFQITPANVAAYSKQAGRQLNPNDPTDSAYMAAQVAKDAQNKYPDNQEAQVAYYNGGNAAGDQVAAGKPTNPETAAYVKHYQSINQGPPAPDQTQLAQNAPPAIPPMPDQSATPPPTVAGPALPGSLAAPVPPPNTPPPMIPQAPGAGQPNMAPQGLILPAQQATNPTAYDMLKFAQSLPEGPQKAQFVQEALKNTLTEPDRLLQAQMRNEMMRQNNLLTNMTRQQGIQAGMRNTDVRAQTSTANTAARNATAVLNTQTRVGGGVNGYGQEYDKLSPAQQATVDTYAVMKIGGDDKALTGMSRIAGGAALVKAVAERVPTMLSELGLDPSDIGSNRAMRVANGAALTHISNDLTTLKPYADALDANADIVKNLAATVIKTQSPLANRTINWLANNAAGDPDVAAYLAQIQYVQNEAARVITNPRLVGQMSHEAVTELQSILNGNMSLDATNRVIDLLKADAGRRIGFMNDQRNTLVDSIKKLTPTAPGSTTSAAAPAVKKVIRFDAQGNEIP